MAVQVQQRGRKFQLRLIHENLPRPHYETFDEEAKAYHYGNSLQAMLDKGIVPLELLEEKEGRAVSPALLRLFDPYMVSTPGPAPTDVPILELLKKDLPKGMRVSDVTASWVDQWIKDMKLVKNYAPGTIRKRVESFARMLDWHIRAVSEQGKPIPGNPLRKLPKGYSNYTPAESAEVADKGLKAKRDVKRERRLGPGEEEKILAALGGWKNPERERPLSVDKDMTLAFKLLVNTGLRLREMVWAQCKDYDPTRGVLHVRGSKGHRGAEKPRVVPIIPALRDELKAVCEAGNGGPAGLIFGFWDGQEPLERVSNRLSARFSTLFSYAGVPDFHEHDLRHEATCRWVQMKDHNGKWMWTELEIAKIMGWSKLDMMLRYASLRAEDFADRML